MDYKNEKLTTILPRLISLSVAMFMLLAVYHTAFSGQNDDIGKRLAGRILLQVERNGEAWYLSPIDYELRYLGRPDDAFELMQKSGIGISNTNLRKIAIAVTPTGIDSDKDGLSDTLEDALGTDKTKADSDSDGYHDKSELDNAYDPLSKDALPIDNSLAQRLKGHILIQTEGKGEAWYVNPADAKRYFLGRPADAFAIMRQTGLGISNVDISRLAIYQPTTTTEPSGTSRLASGNKSYRDPQNAFSLEYPTGWTPGLSSGEKKAFTLRNYKLEVGKEKKAAIIFTRITVDAENEITRFRIASKDGTKKISSTKQEINGKETLAETFVPEGSDTKEINTFIDMEDGSIIAATLFSAGNHDEHEKVFWDIVRSVKITE